MRKLMGVFAIFCAVWFCGFLKGLELHMPAPEACLYGAAFAGVMIGSLVGFLLFAAFVLWCFA